VRGKKRKEFRVALDSNVLISAVVFSGKPREILNLVIRGELILIVSPAILDEVEAVLGGEKFRFSRDAARAVIKEIEALAEIVTPVAAVSVVPEDPDDDGVIACGLDGRADYLVTGDHHLLKLGAYSSLPIVSPAGFLEILVRSRLRE
jgi:putative PIN family toxin of toxin-antitoxin system